MPLGRREYVVSFPKVCVVYLTYYAKSLEIIAELFLVVVQLGLSGVENQYAGAAMMKFTQAGRELLA